MWHFKKSTEFIRVYLGVCSSLCLSSLDRSLSHPLALLLYLVFTVAFTFAELAECVSADTGLPLTVCELLTLLSSLNPTGV